MPRCRRRDQEEEEAETEEEVEAAGEEDVLGGEGGGEMSVADGGDGGGASGFGDEEAMEESFIDEAIEGEADVDDLLQEARQILEAGATQHPEAPSRASRPLSLTTRTSSCAPRSTLAR